MMHSISSSFDERIQQLWQDSNRNHEAVIRMLKSLLPNSEVREGFSVPGAGANQTMSKSIDPIQLGAAFSPTDDHLRAPIYGPSHSYAKEEIAQEMQNHKLDFVENASIESFQSADGVRLPSLELESLNDGYNVDTPQNSDDSDHMVCSEIFNDLIISPRENGSMGDAKLDQPGVYLSIYLEITDLIRLTCDFCGFRQLSLGIINNIDFSNVSRKTHRPQIFDPGPKQINIFPFDSGGRMPEKNPLKITRKYQLELCNKALEENIIVYSKSGRWKIHIAALLIHAMGHLIRKPQRNICGFLTPTVALVQQAEVIENSTKFKTGVDCCNSKRLTSLHDWEEEIKKYEVLSMTLQILLRHLHHCFINVEFIALLYQILLVLSKDEASGMDNHLAEGFSGRDSALLSEAMWLQTLKRYNDFNQALEDVRNIFSSEDNLHDVFRLQIRPSVTFDPFMYLSLPLPYLTMRSMTLVVFCTDGTAKTSTFTFLVLKFGICKDLKHAGSLRDGETFLVAEIYRNDIFCFLVDPSNSLDREKDGLVTYGVPKEIDTCPLIVFIHQQLKMHHSDRSSSSTRATFGVPLVARMSIMVKGCDIPKELLTLLNPFLLSVDAYAKWGELDKTYMLYNHCFLPGKWQKLSSFLHQSMEGPTLDLTKRLIDQVGSEKSSVNLKCRAIKDKMNLLNKQLEDSEKYKSEYLKRYQDAINDKKLADDYMTRITSLQANCSSLDESCSSLLKLLDTAGKEFLDGNVNMIRFHRRKKLRRIKLNSEIAVPKSRISDAIAEAAAAPYSFESFDTVLKPLGKSIRSRHGKSPDEDWVYYSNQEFEVGYSRIDDSTTSICDSSFLQSSKRGLLSWRKRKLKFRSPKAKGEQLLKKAYGEEGGSSRQEDSYFPGFFGGFAMSIVWFYIVANVATLLVAIICLEVIVIFHYFRRYIQVPLPLNYILVPQQGLERQQELVLMPGGHHEFHDDNNIPLTYAYFNLLFSALGKGDVIKEAVRVYEDLRISSGINPILLTLEGY